MRILIHTANLSAGGGLVIGQELIRSLIGKGGAVFVLASPQIATFLQKENVPQDCWKLIPKSPGSSLRAGLLFRKKARKAEAEFQPDVVFTVFGPPLWRPRAPHLCGFANGLYFPKNPVLPYGKSLNFRKKLLHRLRRWLVFHSLKKDTDVIWVETETARKKLLALIGEKEIEVVPNELTAAFKKTPFPESKASKPPYKVLLAAAEYPHKNFSLLRWMLRFPEISPNFVFQTTLPEAAFRKYFPHTSNLQNLGPLSPEALAQAFRNADFIFAPSLAEIFSATWLEAMAARRPLLCADIPETREICGDAALYFNGRKPQSAVAALCRLGFSPELQKTLVENGKARLQELNPKESRADRLYEMLQQIAAPQNKPS